MNKKQFRKNIGRQVRIRPFVERRTSDGKRLRGLDDYWLIGGIINNSSVRLKNTRTDHVKELGFDHIHEFRSPDFLLLRSQVTLCGYKVDVEPLYP